MIIYKKKNQYDPNQLRFQLGNRTIWWYTLCTWILDLFLTTCAFCFHGQSVFPITKTMHQKMKGKKRGNFGSKYLNLDLIYGLEGLDLRGTDKLPEQALNPFIIANPSACHRNKYWKPANISLHYNWISTAVFPNTHFFPTTQTITTSHIGLVFRTQQLAVFI